MRGGERSVNVCPVRLSKFTCMQHSEHTGTCFSHSHFLAMTVVQADPSEITQRSRTDRWRKALSESGIIPCDYEVSSWPLAVLLHAPTRTYLSHCQCQEIFSLLFKLCCASTLNPSRTPKAILELAYKHQCCRSCRLERK